MRELSLFSGAGGGLLGTKLLGWEHIGYVEFNEYCQRVIAQRIEDGILDRAPIFTDVREFLQSGAAEQYRGFADVVTAGFPCQPFSVAGKQQGENDPRNMWPATRDIIRAVRPRYCLLENVPGLLAHEYARKIFGDLAESGFDVRWRVLSAAEVGAPHKRDRVWIVCHTKYAGRDAAEIARSAAQGGNGSKTRKKQASEPTGSDMQRTELADTECKRLQRQGRAINAVCAAEEGEGEANNLITNTGWSTEPDVGRAFDGMA